MEPAGATVDELKPSGWTASPRLKLITVLIVSWINMIYYADRFGISGKIHNKMFNKDWL